MKRAVALLICAIFFGCAVQENGNARGEDSADLKLTITQAGATSFLELNYKGKNQEKQINIQRVDDCSPGWVARQIESGNEESDIFVVRTNMTGYENLLKKGFCSNLNTYEPLASELKQMDNAIIEAISFEGNLYAVPEIVMWNSNSCLLCNTEHPLWKRYNLEYQHSASDILSMMEDLEKNNELDEWWFWEDHEDADHLHNICVTGSVNYLEINERENMIRLPKDEYMEMYLRFDRIRESLLNRINPPSWQEPLFFSINYWDESIFARDNLIPILITPLPGQEELLLLMLEVLILNPGSRNKEEAIQYMEYVVDSFSPVQALALWPEKAEAVENPYKEETGTNWIISPSMVKWYQQLGDHIYVLKKGLMNLFYNNQGVEILNNYLDGKISIKDYIDYLSEKLCMLMKE